MRVYARIMAICMVLVVVLGTIAVAGEVLMILIRLISYFE